MVLVILKDRPSSSHLKHGGSSTVMMNEPVKKEKKNSDHLLERVKEE